MIVTLCGGNNYLLRRRLNEITKGFIKEYGDLAVEKFDGSEVELQPIIDTVQSLPFLATRKLVVVRELSANKTSAENVEKLIAAVGDSTELVFVEPRPDKRSVYFKTLKSKTQLEEFNEMDGHGLARWLTNEATRQGGKLSIADANYLVERVGANQMLLSNELDKLLTYDIQITRQNIDLLTEPTPQSKVFDLLDAAFSGRKQKALELYQDQRAQQVEPQAILAMIAWQLNIIAIAKAADGKSLGQVSKDSGISEYPLRKAQAAASKLSDTEINRLVEEALDIDRRSKTTVIDLDEALKTYITTL